jgi:anthranilate phosphoribosyltransferase
LGVPLNLGPEGVARCVAEAGIGFCFAARFHPGMRHAGTTRRELGVATFFNFLGPLTNPAQPRSALVGCFDPRMAPVMAEVFARRGDSVLLVRGEDGLDEFSTVAPTRVWVVHGGAVTETVLDAAELGLDRAKPDDLRGADAAFNANVARRLFAGEHGPVRDAVLVNAAAALAAQTGPGADLTGTLSAGLDRATAAIDSGSAAHLLARWVAVATEARAAE